MKIDRLDIIAHLLLAATVALLGWPILLAGQGLYYGDITLQFVPWREFARTQLLAGVVPWWLPDVYFGLPFVANGQAAVFYPWHWLTLAVPGVMAVSLGYLAHLWLTAAGGYAWARRGGRSRQAALLCGLILGLGGYSLSKQQFPSLAHTLAWLPWLLWATRRLVEPGAGLAAAARLALVGGLMWLAGHAQMAAIQLALAGAYAAYLSGVGRTSRPLALWAGGVGWGLGLAAVGWLTTFELLGWSARQSFGFDDVARFNLPPWHWLGFVLPWPYGHPAGRLPYLGEGAPWETAVYLGAAALPLALAAARRERFWVGVAVVGLVLAAGRYLPVYRLLTEQVALFRMFRDPARFSLYPVVATAWLAAVGFDQARDEARVWSLRVAAVVAVGWVVAAVLPATVWRALLDGLLAASPGRRLSDPTAAAAALAGWQLGQLGGAAVLLAVTVGLLGSAQPAARRGLVVWLALDLLLAGRGLNPLCDRAQLAGLPEVPALAQVAGRIEVPADRLTALALAQFDLSSYRRPPDLAPVRRGLVGNQAVGTRWQVTAGYDPLRPAAVLAWLTATEALPARQRAARLAEVGVLGRWDGERWEIFAAPPDDLLREGAGLLRPTVNREQLWPPPAGGRVARADLPGWRVVGGRQASGDHPVAVTIVPGAGPWPVRAWYAPTTARVGLFVSLLAWAGLIAARAVCNMSVR